MKGAGRLSAVVAALGCVAGCYESHGREAPSGAERDASPGIADSGAVVDAGAPIVDASMPPSPPLPPLPDDEPDVGPDERPSDDPGADAWMDTPSGIGGCCEVGEVVGLDDIERQASAPRVAWDGSEWGVTWGDMPTLATAPLRLVLRRIDVDARPTLDLVTVDERGARPTGMAFGNHRFAITTATGRDAPRPGRLVVTDRDGRIRDERTFPDDLGGFAVARHPAVHGWATVATESDPEGDASARAHLLVFDETLTEVARHPLEWVHTDSGGGSAIVASKSMLVVASGEASTVIRTYRGSAIEEVDATDVGPLGTELTGAAFRDTAVFAGREYDRGPLFTLVWDPFERRVISGPRNVGPTRSGQGLSIAADSIGGTLGLCYPTGGGSSRDADALTFVLLGPDGAPIGEPVVVASGLRYVAACAVASAGPDTYVVVFWNAARDAARHSILAARVSVRR